MKNWIKNILYKTALFIMKLYWRVFKPKTYGARIILVTDTKVFLVQPRTTNFWNIPGGGIGKKEDPESGALRELYEETKIKIDSTDYLLGTYTSSDEGKHDTIYFFVKKLDSELIAKPDVEIGQAGWFAFGQLPEGTTARTKMRIQEYLDGGKNKKGSYHDLYIIKKAE